MYSQNVELGKFEACASPLVGRVLLEASLDSSWTEAELGEVSYFGFYTLILGRKFAFITLEDELGFFTYRRFDTHAEALEYWRDLEAAYELAYESTI